MPGLRTFTTVERVAYATLSNTKASGALIGSYLDEPIYETITDDFGRRYRYLGLAPRLSSGRFDPDALRRGQFILLPGPLYAIEDPRRPAPAVRLRGLAPKLQRHRERGSH